MEKPKFDKLLSSYNIRNKNCVKKEIYDDAISLIKLELQAGKTNLDFAMDHLDEIMCKLLVAKYNNDFPHITTSATLSI